jgi:ribosomal protein L37AE/L43A
MNGLAWNPKWWHQAESFWSLLNKLAYANVTSLGEILDFLGFSEAKGQRSLLFSPSAGRAVQLCLALELSPSVATSLFASIGPRRFEARSCTRLALRWCPWHGSRLRDSCPKCGRKIDPVGNAAWTCNGCLSKINSPGAKWLNEFKIAPNQGVPVTALTEHFEYVPARAVQGLKRYRQHCTPDAPHKPASSWQLEYLCLSVAYEEGAALADTVFQQHRNCFLGEGRAANPAYEPTTFTCPIAGATAKVLGLFGTTTEAARGEWMVQSKMAQYTLNGLAASQLDNYPDWCHTFIVQELVRGWLSEALPAFIEAAKTGSDKVAWRPSQSAGVCCRIDSDVLYLT